MGPLVILACSQATSAFSGSPSLSSLTPSAGAGGSSLRTSLFGDGLSVMLAGTSKQLGTGAAVNTCVVSTVVSVLSGQFGLF